MNRSTEHDDLADRVARARRRARRYRQPTDNRDDLSARVEHVICTLILCALAVWMLAGCATEPEIRWRTRTVEVEVPVPVHREPPAELTAAPELPRPAFVHPDDDAASSALTPDGETALRGLILELLARERAWRAWASEPEETAGLPHGN